MVATRSWLVQSDDMTFRSRSQDQANRLRSPSKHIAIESEADGRLFEFEIIIPNAPREAAEPQLLTGFVQVGACADIREIDFRQLTKIDYSL
ncbi:MAG: hypothetical protein ACKVP7_09840 [Hyphomicrobiaceae bacterium]